MTNSVLLTNPNWADSFSFCPVIFDPRDAACDVLLCIFGPIVPADVLSRYRRAYNFHPGSPAYPGRDPHHWAIYDNAGTFGVTLHEMVARVDEGPIVHVEEFAVETHDPAALRDKANLRAVAMVTSWGPRLLAETPTAKRTWCGTKHRRADLLAMCDLRGLPDDERERRHRAFAGFISP